MTQTNPQFLYSVESTLQESLNVFNVSLQQENKQYLNISYSLTFSNTASSFFLIKTHPYHQLNRKTHDKLLLNTYMKCQKCTDIYIIVEVQEGKHHFGYLSIDGRIILTNISDHAFDCANINPISHVCMMGSLVLLCTKS